MLALLGFLVLIMCYGISRGLFRKGHRLFGWLIAVLAFVAQLTVSNKMEHDAKAAGFQSSSDLYAAHEAGIDDPSKWKLVRGLQHVLRQSQPVSPPASPKKTAIEL
jgi:hypothetical protein